MTGSSGNHFLSFKCLIIVERVLLWLAKGAPKTTITQKVTIILEAVYKSQEQKRTIYFLLCYSKIVIDLK
jgi:hypothetical protein